MLRLGSGLGCAYVLLAALTVRAEPPDLAALLGTEVRDIDLASALQLAGVRNPELLIARQRVSEAVAQRQLAAAQILPTLQYGASVNNHDGPLQQSGGNLLEVNRNSIYFGAGAFAVGAGTVNIPGVVYNVNVSQALFDFLAQRQVVVQRQFASRAVENQVLLRTGVAYTELLRAEGRRSLAALNLTEAREVVRLTRAFAEAGAGREGDFNRARTEESLRESELRAAEGQAQLTSARLAQLLNLEPTLRLRPTDTQVVPLAVVPEPIPLCELIALALLYRPELHERQAAIREALLRLQSARALPFSPNLFLGLSFGGEGGGSNLVNQPLGTTPFARSQPYVGRFGERLDFDALAYWMVQNLGIGNDAQIREARSRAGMADLRWIEVLNRVRADVANAHVRTHARFAQIATNEEAVRVSELAFQEDTARIRDNVGLPIELLQSLLLLGRARYAYFDAIINYNEAELELYVALGQPPADLLARPVPPGFVPPAQEKKDEAK